MRVVKEGPTGSSIDRLAYAIGSVVEVGVAVGAAGLKAASAVIEQGSRAVDDRTPLGMKLLGNMQVVGRTVTVAKPRSTLFAWCRNLPNLASILTEVERIRLTGSHRSIWEVRSSGRGVVEVETEIVTEVTDRLIAWRSVEGAPLSIGGQVTFGDAPGERGTRVSLMLSEEADSRARGWTNLHSPQSGLRALHDLKRFKMLMETGEIATSARRRTYTLAAPARGA